MIVIDGLGGLPRKNLTELEFAHTPNLDSLASRSICGLLQLVGPGISPGSGPGHLALFGYDPLKYTVGRGVLSALGIDFELGTKDIAARGNFCTLDSNGFITDRRAGRIPSDKNKELCFLLQEIELPDIQIFVETVKDYRFLLVLRGEDLCDEISDTDPQAVGKKPLPPKPLSQKARRTAGLIESFLNQAREILEGHHPANMILLRGFSKKPEWPSIKEVFGLKSAAIANYPMYRGLARLIGMDILKTGDSIRDEFKTLKRHFEDFDFFYLHVKKSDSAGEDGDFKAKVDIIQEVDKQIPELLELNPDVIIVTGDHSTPSLLKSHSWHPVPVLLSSKYCRSDDVKEFGERACMKGGLGPRFPAEDLMVLALANANRLKKYGA
jgi:2,3-bisphosphoglycerate-independent phosphoglycerate mutase